jgi:hypothetical protein
LHVELRCGYEVWDYIAGDVCVDEGAADFGGARWRDGRCRTGCLAVGGKRRCEDGGEKDRGEGCFNCGKSKKFTANAGFIRRLF